jgi:hypothetical protein
MDVTKLVDEAFMRRIQTKIKIDYVSREQFHQIFANACRTMKVEYEPTVVEHVIELIKEEIRQPLRACYPLDVLNQVIWAAKYAGKEPKLTNAAVEQACQNYFVAPAA